MDHSPPGSVHVIPSKNTGVGDISYSRGSSWPKVQTCISCIGRRILYHWANWRKKIPFFPVKDSGNEKPWILCLLLLLLFSHQVTSDSVTPWFTALQASLSFTNSWSLLKLMSIESMMPSNHLLICRPLLLLPSIFHNGLALHIRWPTYLLLPS